MCKICIFYTIYNNFGKKKQSLRNFSVTLSMSNVFVTEKICSLNDVGSVVRLNPDFNNRYPFEIYFVYL